MAKSKPIFVPGTNQAFASAAAAARALGINAGNITQVLKGRRKTAGGYSWAYAENRSIYIPETGKTYKTIHEAARSVKVNTKKVESILENNVSKTVGGYHFEYVDTSKITPIAATGSRSSATKHKNRKKNKQERQRTRKQNKQKKFEDERQKAAERKSERAASSARQVRKQQERLEKIRTAYDASITPQKTSLLSNEAKELRVLMERINDQLKKYQDANMMGYSQVAQDVEDRQQYLNLLDDDNDMFDTSDENMFAIMKEMSSDKILQWAEQLNDVANSRNGLFWNLQKQIQEREAYALEFGVAPEEMEKYVDLLPEVWKLFEQARHFSMYEKIGQHMWTDIQSSIKSGIDPDEFRRIIDELQKWDGTPSKELQKTLNELEESIHLTSVFDDDDLPF